jgi:hypothetical protein
LVNNRPGQPATLNAGLREPLPPRKNKVSVQIAYTLCGPLASPIAVIGPTTMIDVTQPLTNKKVPYAQRNETYKRGCCFVCTNSRKFPTGTPKYACQLKLGIPAIHAIITGKLRYARKYETCPNGGKIAALRKETLLTFHAFGPVHTRSKLMCGSIDSTLSSGTHYSCQSQ